MYYPFSPKVLHLFVSINLNLKHKWRELRDKIVALERTTRSFCRRSIQMTQCLFSVPGCNWWLWIRYISIYFTYPFPAFSVFNCIHALCSCIVNDFLCFSLSSVWVTLGRITVKFSLIHSVMLVELCLTVILIILVKVRLKQWHHQRNFGYGRFWCVVCVQAWR